jgi:hypothetical protein
MLKLMDLLREVKVGDAYISSDGKYIELVFDTFMKGKWRTIGFDLGPMGHFVRDIGTSPEHTLGMDGKLKKLSSSQKNAIKKMLKNPEDIDMIKRDGQNVNKVLKALK